MVDQLAKSSKNTEDFVRQIGKTFAGFPKGKLTLSPDPVNRSLGLGGTGFRREMNDGDGHPWRHGSAFIVAGYDHGETAGKVIAYLWETPGLRGASSQDVVLGSNAAELGAGLKSGTIQPAQAAQWIRDQW